MSDRIISEIISMIMGGYLVNHCQGCPFYGIKEFEIEQICDSKPINCSWRYLWRHFEAAEEDEEKAERKITMERITELDLIDLLYEYLETATAPEASDAQVETIPAVAETLRTILCPNDYDKNKTDREQKLQKHVSTNTAETKCENCELYRNKTQGFGVRW